MSTDEGNRSASDGDSYHEAPTPVTPVPGAPVQPAVVPLIVPPVAPPVGKAPGVDAPAANAPTLEKPISPPNRVSATVPSVTAPELKPVAQRESESPTAPPPPPIIAAPPEPQPEVAAIAHDPLLQALPKRVLNGKLYPFISKNGKAIYLLSLLGSGGMGAVYLGQTANLKKKVAVKVLSCSTGTDSTFTKRFKQEAQFAAELRSRYLVQVDDADEEGGLHFIVMEYVYGKTAAGWLNQEKSARRKISEADALAVCMAATRGLKTMHASEIVHRDIKPGNIFIPFGDDDNSLVLADAKLGDLGLARKSGTEDDPVTLGSRVTMGTPGYAAPEQIRSSKQAGKPCDVFSMGATLYTLLAGRQPWTGDSSYIVLENTVNKPHEALESVRSDVSPAVIALISACLSKQPEQRYKDGEELLLAMQAAANGRFVPPKSLLPPVISVPVKRVESPVAEQPASDSSMATIHFPPPIERSEGARPVPPMTASPPLNAAPPPPEPPSEMSLIPPVIAPPPARAPVAPQVEHDSGVSIQAEAPSPGFAFRNSAGAVNVPPTVPTPPVPNQVAPKVAPTAAPNVSPKGPGVNPENASCKRAYSENVQFTVYRPKSIPRDVWTAILAFAHLSDSLKEVEKQAKDKLGEKIDDYANLSADSGQRVPRKGLITFIPEMEGAEFDPPRRSFFWTEQTHCETFKIKPGTDFAGKTLKGKMTVFCGPLLLAEIALSVRVDGVGVEPDKNLADFQKMDPCKGVPFKKIYASYSPEDAEIVKACESFAETIGDRYVRNWTDRRKGGKFSHRIEDLIEQASVFQLFWSENAARSEYVRQEIDYAMSLSRQGFVRPIYWQDTVPSADKIPAVIRGLAFKRLPVFTLPGASGPDAWAPQPPDVPGNSVVPSAKPVNVVPSRPDAGHAAQVVGGKTAPVNSTPAAVTPPSSLIAKLVAAAIVSLVLAAGWIFAPKSLTDKLAFWNKTAGGGEPAQTTTQTTTIAANSHSTPTSTATTPTVTNRSAQGVGGNAANHIPFRILAGDSPGASVFHAPDVKTGLDAQKLALIFDDSDGGDTTKRLDAVNSGNAELAVVSLAAFLDWARRTGQSNARIVLILAETPAANALVIRYDSVKGPEYIERLTSSDGILYSRQSTDDALFAHSTSDAAVKFGRTAPKLEALPSLGFVLKRYYKSSDEWDSHLYIVPEITALQLEREKGRILLERGSVDVLVAHASVWKDHAADLAYLFKVYFTALHRTSKDRLEQFVFDAVSREHDKAVQADAQRIVGQTHWFSASDNYAALELNPGLGKPIPELKSLVSNVSPAVLKILFDERFVAVPGEVAVSSRWPSIHVAPLKTDIEMSRGPAEIGALQDDNFEAVSKILTLFPDSFLIVQGHYPSDSFENKKLALERAEIVKLRLQKNGVSPDRLRIEIPARPDDIKLRVTFILSRPRG